MYVRKMSEVKTVWVDRRQNVRMTDQLDLARDKVSKDLVKHLSTQETNCLSVAQSFVYMGHFLSDGDTFTCHHRTLAVWVMRIHL